MAKIKFFQFSNAKILNKKKFLNNTFGKIIYFLWILSVKKIKILSLKRKTPARHRGFFKYATKSDEYREYLSLYREEKKRQIFFFPNRFFFQWHTLTFLTMGLCNV